ncbi:hypothetical protein [Flavobacterium sp. 7A]|uniref:hypothetical protein n=1 Tax=Flavobacterium sp. 7A TaxID=2940571 RepID=UPI00222748D8|nr:hypothetical protein [Flavobacterium sp. 7A]MCW2119330.1 hypothetical protein [Flavobacterium sp. 7A]
MKKQKLFSYILTAVFCYTINAQTTDSTTVEKKFNVNTGIDILNNYIWRGVPLDKGPNLQPSVILNYDKLKLSFLGSYSLKYEFNNIMTVLSYDIDTKIGTISPTLSHYYYPYDGVKLSDYRRHDGSFSHITELGFQYLGDKIPLRIYTSMNIVNDVENSTYFEAGYSLKVNQMTFEPFVGGVFNKSPDWQAATSAGLLNIGFNIYKEVKVASGNNLPLTGTLSYHTQLDLLSVMVRLSVF